MLGSVGAIVAALVMLATGWYLADPILSAGIGLLILWSSWRLLRESVEVLLEATPGTIRPRDVQQAMAEVDGVVGMHDLHVWTVTSGLIAMSGHVEVTGQRAWRDVLIELTTIMRDRFGIAHATLQPEQKRVGSDTTECSLDSAEGRAACLVSQSPVAANVQMHDHHRH